MPLARVGVCWPRTRRGRARGAGGARARRASASLAPTSSHRAAPHRARARTQLRCERTGAVQSRAHATHRRNAAAARQRQDLGRVRGERHTPHGRKEAGEGAPHGQAAVVRAEPLKRLAPLHLRGMSAGRAPGPRRTRAEVKMPGEKGCGDPVTHVIMIMMVTLIDSLICSSPQTQPCERCSATRARGSMRPVT